MSLKVWLPLNGTLDNLGSSKLTITNNGATVNSSGKIGSCYHFGTASSYMTLPANVMTNFTTCSVSFWIKIKTWNTSYATYFQAGMGSSSWNNYIFGFLRNSTNSTICFTISNGSTASNASYLTSTITLDQWYHVALTYETGKCKIYLNGLLDKEYTTSIVPNFSAITKITLGASNTTSSYQTDCDMNDFRIYDHCLSAAEVKEISQGLILHYKLNGFNNSSILPTGYQQLEYIESTGTSYFDTEYKFNIETDACKVIFKGNDTSNNGMIFANSGSKYFWFYYYSSNGIRVYAHNGSNGQQGIAGITSDLNQHIMEFKNKTYYIDGVNKGSLTNTYTEGSSNIWLFSYGGNNYPFKGRIYYVDIQRNGKYQKIFIPAKRLTDAAIGMYDLITNTFYVSSNAMFTAGTGIGTLTIQDSSGYGHNGETFGTLSLSTDTPRYSYCAIFNGTNTRIKVPNLTPEAITVSFWMKRGANTGTRQFMYTAWTGVTCELKTDGTPTFAVNRSNYPTIVGSAITVDSDWVHYCGTFNTINGLKLYQNGVLKSSDSTLTPIVWNITTNYIGYYNTYYNGLMSDFRIYCTALSAEDVLQLYRVGAKVDNKQNLHTGEFIEADEELIDTNTTIKGHYFFESPTFELTHYDNTIYQEPDGSYWVRIFHHNNPANALFSNGANWKNGVYLDADRWFDIYPTVEIMPTYEFMVKQKTTSGATETKYRWIQTVSPLTATYDNVKPAAVTRITTSGYTDNTTYGGGIYNPSSDKTHMVIANTTNGNWWGATGSWTIYQSGIPGSLGTVVTTGYMDLYARIYPYTKFIKNTGFAANHLIER